MAWIVALAVLGLISISYWMRPAGTQVDPAPDTYDDDEREALLMTQLYRSEHLVRRQRRREREGDTG